MQLSPNQTDRAAGVLLGQALGFLGWYADGPADIGNQTRAVLASVTRHIGSSPKTISSATTMRRRPTVITPAPAGARATGH